VADYYNILGINKSASEEEIKKAYRRLAHKFHPDKAGGDEKKFKEINEAYQVLSNKQKRAQYDRFGRVFDGASGFSSGAGREWGFEGWPFGQGVEFGFDPSAFEDGGDLGGIFESIFEGLGVRKKRRTYQRGADMELVLEISLEEAFSGAQKSLRFDAWISCAACGGQGADAKSGFKTCGRCDGRGEVRENQKTFFGDFSRIRPCVECEGEGRIPQKRCHACGGTGRIRYAKEIAVDIQQGIGDGQLIKIVGAGEAGMRGATAGDVYVRIKTRTHAQFRRDGDNLHYRAKVNLVDILLGKSFEVLTIEGKKVHFTIPEGFNLRDSIRIRGAGMPRLGSHECGDLIVELDLATPKYFSSKAKEILEDLRKELE